MASSANKLMKEMQQIAANAQVKVQELANQATEKSFQYNTQEAATARQFNSQEAKVARDWQEEMSNTAHQREVSDLKKAGLNPVLSANGGAQSYTTSSASAQAASAQANDASGTIGNLAGNLIQSRTGAYQADVSAKATRYAAATTAAATRAAAAQAASAQRYAAAMAYQNNRMHEQWQNEYLKKETESKIKIANSIPVNSVGGVLDKFAIKSGLYDLVGTKVVKNVVSSMKTFLNNGDRYFSNTGKVNSSNFVLSKAGKTFVNMQLARFGLNINKQNRLAFVKAFAFGVIPYQNMLVSQIKRRRGYTLR